MEYLQYKGSITVVKDGEHVLNLVISGIPSIPAMWESGGAMTNSAEF